ncbi:DEAD/DEAH box helicase [Dasania sp. GY-MA-18]|uniref:DEAD/DEAH box helicase n=1 Tax=Dasania phycosphaerae TaxID=2950436 RepID=A0A9J6RMW9_9GAMM|nr:MULTISPECIES: DEAD/DEAH box helicase [Dasania]MCR8923442.1 DEAD/DEAH box helicase [Dasania sp. GY-MA-18]MCZ0865875.1 DEAD/DEAH box helicase [Dasania phycosphaerae]MCZ0869599.1 DEAD/DEAH box helicase [Dasania phycosphaerae]
MTFKQLGLCPPILQALSEQAYSSPTAIQAQAIPAVLAGRDVLATAPTGTGKTASFVLPLLQRLQPDPASSERKRRAKRLRALVLVPTRELAIQVATNIEQYGKHLSLKTITMFGGVDGQQQKQQLIEGVDIVVATPGRLLDMAQQRALHFDELQMLVLDEADRMLDMGFIGDINRIISRLPERRQNLLLSATLSDEVRLLAKTAIHNPVELTVAPDKAGTSHINQWLVSVDKDKKSALLSHLITEQACSQGLIFIRTKHGAAKLVSQLEKRGIKAESIHSGRSQAMRTQLLADFKAGAINFLVATGIAARGIDITELQCVINYDLPDDADDYIHRIGRTGRAGASGEAISLVSKDDFKRLCAIERSLGKIITRKVIVGFEPVKDLPASNLNFSLKNTTRDNSRTKKSSNEKPVKKKTTQKRRAEPSNKASPKLNEKSNVSHQQKPIQSNERPVAGEPKSKRRPLTGMKTSGWAKRK